MVRPLFFLLIVAPLSFGGFLFWQHQVDRQRDEVEATQAKVIQHDVEERLRFYLSGTLGARVVATTFWHQDVVDDAEYEALASKLVEAFPEIMAVNEVNPQGLIARVHPRDANAAALGKMSQNAAALVRARERGETTWFGPPLNLFQGGRGFICYLALTNKKGQHQGWLALVVSTQKFFEFFTNNEFGANFDVAITDVLTGESYIGGPASSLREGKPLFNYQVSEFGRPIHVAVWPRQSLRANSSPWLWPLALAALFSLISTMAYRWWLERMTALKRLEDLNQLLRLTIHDSASSLGTIKGYLEIMKADASLVPIYRLSRHVGFVIDLLEQIKQVRELSSNRAHWKLERLSLLNLVLEVSEVMEERLKNKDLFLRYDPEELGQIQLAVNRTLFAHSVLGNLLVHAITHSPQGATITLQYRLYNGCHEISVTDQGQGPSSSTLEMLRRGKPDERLNSFGLLIAQQVVDLHGGSLEVLPHSDKGTVVRVRLPHLFEGSGHLGLPAIV